MEDQASRQSDLSQIVMSHKTGPKKSRVVITTIFLVTVFGLLIALLCATTGLAVYSHIQIAGIEYKNGETHNISKGQRDQMLVQMKQMEFQLKVSIDEVRETLERFKVSITNKVNTLDSTTNHGLDYLQLSLNTLNAMNMEQHANIISSVNMLNTTTMDQLRAAESSRGQLQAEINTCHDTFLARASQIENTVNTNRNNIENTVSAHYNSLINRGGATYIRWGNNACPSGAAVVYTGRVGGTQYEHEGGASNQVCLPEFPTYFGNSRSGFQGRSYMYGAEYVDPINGEQDGNVPCAVCSVTTRQQVLMIPATYICPSGWIREYDGYLMSERINNYRSSFICVDYVQYSIAHTGSHTEASDLVHVETDCSSLPCGPYNGEYELTCAVCTK